MVVVREVETILIKGVNVVGGADQRMPDRAQVNGGIVAEGMMKELDLRASFWEDGPIRGGVGRVGQVVDSEDKDGVGVGGGRPNVNTMSDKWPGEIGKGKSS